MKVEQIQKIEQIVEELDKLKTHAHWRLDLVNDWWGKIGFNEIFKNVDDMIDDLYDHDTKDIMDGGLNELSIPNDDDQYWCKHPDENGNKIPMTKVEGSRVMSKEEVEELNKIKLPF